MARRLGRYGVDGSFEHVPLWAQAASWSAVLTLLAAAAVHGAARRRPWQGLVAGGLGVSLAGVAALYLQATLAGKFAVWERVLDGLHLGGDEDLLDLGCGRGAVLLAAARRLPRGRAIGIDLWRPDQSGNRHQATWRNAEMEGVADRTRLCTGDITALPFREATFDVVVSNLALHNLPDETARRRAIEEVARVLRSGGRVRLGDLAFTRQHAGQLRQMGLRQVERRNAGWRVWFGAPFLPEHIVAATRG